MQWFIDCLSLVPATFWGVVVGSFFTLCGVHLSNRASDRRLSAQLVHDRALKDKEREFALRRDIYLATAEAISAGLNAIARFADLNIPHDQIMASYTEKSSAIAKVHVIAKEETAKAILNLVSEITAVSFRISVKRFQLIGQRQALTDIQTRIDGFSKERDRWLEQMKQYNLEGINDPRRWQVIDGNFHFERDRIDKLIQDQKQIGRDLTLKNANYLREVASESVALQALITPVIVAVRTELEMPVDGDTYAALLQESGRKNQITLSEFLQGIDSEINKTLAKEKRP